MGGSDFPLVQDLGQVLGNGHVIVGGIGRASYQSGFRSGTREARPANLRKYWEISQTLCEK